MSDLENGYCPLNGHGVYGGLPARPCPWCQIVELKKAMAESCDDMRFEYAGCERAEAAEAEVERITAIIKREADLHNERQIHLEAAEAKLAGIRDVIDASSIMECRDALSRIYAILTTTEQTK